LVNEEKHFFSEEKKQKTFASLGLRQSPPHAKIQKFFGSLFQKTTSFLHLAPQSQIAHPRKTPKATVCVVSEPPSRAWYRRHYRINA
jgi:hypothetical protein